MSNTQSSRSVADGFVRSLNSNDLESMRATYLRPDALSVDAIQKLRQELGPFKINTSDAGGDENRGADTYYYRALGSPGSVLGVAIVADEDGQLLVESITRCIVSYDGSYDGDDTPVDEP